MSDYTITLKLTCGCGATFELCDKYGNKEWVVSQSQEWQRTHDVCLKAKLPEVKIPEKKP